MHTPPSSQALHGLGLQGGVQGVGIFYDVLIDDAVGLRIGYNRYSTSQEISRDASTSSSLFTDSVTSVATGYDLSGESVNVLFDFYFGPHTGFRFTLGSYFQLEPLGSFFVQANYVDPEDSTMIPSPVRRLLLLAMKIKDYPILDLATPLTRANLKGLNFSLMLVSSIPIFPTRLPVPIVLKASLPTFRANGLEMHTTPCFMLIGYR